MQLTKILWVEEETEFNLLEVKSYLESNPKFRIDIVDTYDRCIEIIEGQGEIYDLFIVDILIPESYKNRNLDTRGLEVIDKLVELNLSEKSCVFTNEVWEAVQKRLDGKLPRARYLQKNECRTNKAFEEFISKIIN